MSYDAAARAAADRYASLLAEHRRAWIESGGLPPVVLPEPICAAFGDMIAGLVELSVAGRDDEAEAIMREHLERSFAGAGGGA